MSNKSILDMVGGEKYINPRYGIKEESTIKSFTGIEVNGVRFSNIQEMLVYMDKQKNEIENLKAQIEKMKCCENCKHSDTECKGYTICGIGHYDDCLSNKVLYHTTDEKDYWELEEND